MPGWSEIMDTVQQQKQEMVPAFLLNECKRYLSLIANITGRNIIDLYG